MYSSKILLHIADGLMCVYLRVYIMKNVHTYIITKFLKINQSLACTTIGLCIKMGKNDICQIKSYSYIHTYVHNLLFKGMYFTAGL